MVSAGIYPGINFVNFAGQMRAISQSARPLIRLFSLLLAGIIYLSFFLVQFDIHLEGVPQDISYFSGDSNTVTGYEAAQHVRIFEICKKARPIFFRLNKRFQPKKFFEVFFYQGNILSRETVWIDLPIKPEKPILKNSVEPHSRRGPPELVFAV